MDKLVTVCSISFWQTVLLLTVEAGKHWMWKWGGTSFHGQTMLAAVAVLLCMFLIALLLIPKMHTVPGNGNVAELGVMFVVSLVKAQMKYYYRSWVSFIGTLFAFIPISNWLGILIPWKIIKLPNSEITSSCADINTTVALALLVSIAYFYAGIQQQGLSYFLRHIQPTPISMPINILEDFTKPLSLSFRLFGNTLADELVVAVLLSLVPLFIPIPMLLLGLFTGIIQASIFATLATAYISEAKEKHE